MAKRKTVDVEWLRKTANDMLGYCTEEQAQGLVSLLTTVLHETGNYKGYREFPENTEVHPSPYKGRQYY